MNLTLPNNFFKSLCIGSFLTAVSLTQAVAAPILPDPFDPNDVSTYHDTNSNGTFEAGIDVPYSLRLDDFYTYSIDLLQKYFPAAGWDTSSGTGNLDVIVTTRSAGASNSTIGFNIPEPIVNSNDATLTGSWGDGGSAATTMLVDDLYNYLITTFQGSIPVFVFDQNETGGNPDIDVTALVEIINPLNDSVVAQWSLDSLTNGVFDSAAFVNSAGQICVPDGITQTVNLDYCFSNNLGSGKFENVIFAPTMNLANYIGNGYVFRGSWNFMNADNGGEEITLTGRFAPEIPPQPLPVPGTLFMMSFALLLMSVARRFKRR